MNQTEKKDLHNSLTRRQPLGIRFLDPAFEQDRFTTLGYGNDMSIKEMHKIDGTTLINCIKSPPKKESDFRNAIDKVMNTKIKQYSTLFKMFIRLLSVFGDQCKDQCKDLQFL